MKKYGINPLWAGLLLISIFLSPLFVEAEVTLPSILGSNMVVQREIGTNVWGWAKPGEKIVVAFRDQTVKTKADKNGAWKVKIPTGEAGGPFLMTVQGENKVVLDNILVGDVWLCGGQSNMEFTLKQAENGAIEAKKANLHSIRQFKVEKNAALIPVEKTAPGNWLECNPQNAPDFSAVGYFFAKKIFMETGIPIGLIYDNWGGTMVETWTSEEGCKTDSNLVRWIAEMKKIDAEELAKNQLVIFEKYREELAKVEKPDWDHEYIHPEYDDSKWYSFAQPALWETQEGYEYFDGVMWYRKSVVLPHDFNCSNAKISLARIDDSDITWINGKRVGETFNQYNLVRVYEIPREILREGKNQLVVRMEDYTGGGGFHGSASEMYLTDGVQTIDLSGEWKIMKDELKTPSNPENPSQSPIQPNQFPALLFNGMINPVINYAMKGVIWYQGEANADRMNQALSYQSHLENMITDWRKRWGVGDFPFYQVQLANFRQETPTPPQTDVWPYLREAQANVAKFPHAGMACIIDIGNANDIHPTDKLDVGNRLAIIALKNDYGKNIISGGPKIDHVSFEENKVFVSFKEVGKGLVVKNKYGYITGFAVAGFEKEFHYAKATLAGKDRVMVTCDSVSKIEAVRFLWADNPGEITLYNSEGLPAEPFRTDNW